MPLRGSYQDRLPWGDGFADDGWTDAAHVAVWDDVHPDEYLRFFPRLPTHPDAWPACLLTHLRNRVAALARDARRQGGPTEGHTRGIPPVDERETATQSRHPRVMILEGLSQGGAGLVPLPRRRDDRAGIAAADLRRLTAVLDGLRQGALDPFDPETATDFAYLSGIHPAYLWPEAAHAHESFAAAGWLGVIARGRAALMPPDIAAYFIDVIEAGGGGPVRIRDETMRRLVARSVDLHDLWHAARQRQRGVAAIVRVPRRSGLAGLGGLLSTLLRVPGNSRVPATMEREA